MMYNEKHIQCFDSTYLFVDSFVCIFGCMGPCDGNLLFIQCSYVLCSLWVVIVSHLHIVWQSYLMKKCEKIIEAIFPLKLFPHSILYCFFPLKHCLCFFTPNSFVLNIQHNIDHHKQQTLSTDRHKHHTKVVFLIISMKM